MLPLLGDMPGREPFHPGCPVSHTRVQGMKGPPWRGKQRPVRLQPVPPPAPPSPRTVSVALTRAPVSLCLRSPTHASLRPRGLPAQPAPAGRCHEQVRSVPPLWGRRARSDPAAGAAPAEGVKGDPCQAGTEAGEGRSACGPRPQSAAALWAGRTWAALPARLIIQGPAPAAGSSFQQAAPDRDRRAGGQERKNHRALLKNGPRFTGLLRRQRWAGQQWDLQAGFADRGAGVGRAGVEASRVHSGA